MRRFEIIDAFFLYKYKCKLDASLLEQIATSRYNCPCNVLLLHCKTCHGDEQGCESGRLYLMFKTKFMYGCFKDQKTTNRVCDLAKFMFVAREKRKEVERNGG